MGRIKINKQNAKAKLNSIIDQLSKDLQTTERLFKDVVMLDGSPAQVYSHLTLLSAELDEINKMTNLMKTELQEI